jgi:hypothetical protein
MGDYCASFHLALGIGELDDHDPELARAFVPGRVRVARVEKRPWPTAILSDAALCPNTAFRARPSRHTASMSRSCWCIGVASRGSQHQEAHPHAMVGGVPI